MKGGDMRVELDVVDEKGDGCKELIAEAQAHGCKLTIIALEGPGGGNPLVVLEGDEAPVRKLLTKWAFLPDGELVPIKCEHAEYGIEM